MKRLMYLCCLALILAGVAAADEGMWLYNAPPKAKLKAAYHFEPSEPWLDHLRLSSVKFGGASGSFVSPDGLVFTNHHVGRGCVHDLSTADKDYVKNGFYARTRAEELKCPAMELNVLQSIEDVTAKVKQAEKPGATAAEAGKARRAAQASIEKECATTTGLKCESVTLYSGAMYHLYRYKRYTDVRLVFAPEFDIAFFGGDPDNFTYPRFDLDVTFFRVYENGQPAKAPEYLKWSMKGIKEGELVFVSGHPGSTGRLNTMAQRQFLRDVQYPFTLASLKRRIDLLKKFAAESAENSRVAERELFGLENSFKATTGYQVGLLDKAAMEKKAAEEKKFREKVAADPKLKAEFGDPWAELEKAVEAHKKIFVEHFYLENQGGYRGSLARYAHDLVRVTAEKQKPNTERIREYRDAGLPSFERRLFSTAPVYKPVETVMLADSLAEMQEKLGAQDARVMKALAGKTPVERAKELIEGTKLNEVALRRQLYQGGVAAVEASDDPLIAFMHTVDADGRALRKRMEDEVNAVETSSGGKVARIMFGEYGMNMPPDATGTLRLSYGAAKGYVENGQKIPYFTTIGGAFDHAAKAGNKQPDQLPESWMKAKNRLALKTPLNQASTPDIIGGNSGSPVVNRNAELVGIIFDGNIQSLPWRFQYEDVIGRSVSVDTRGIIEALRKIYGANELADELLGVAPRQATTITGN